MIHQSSEFLDERLLGQLYGLIEARLHTLAFLLVQLRTELTQVRRWLDTGEVVLDGKQTDQRGRVVT